VTWPELFIEFQSSPLVTPPVGKGIKSVAGLIGELGAVRQAREETPGPTFELPVTCPALLMARADVEVVAPPAKPRLFTTYFGCADEDRDPSAKVRTIAIRLILFPFRNLEDIDKVADSIYNFPTQHSSPIFLFLEGGIFASCSPLGTAACSPAKSTSDYKL